MHHEVAAHVVSKFISVNYKWHLCFRADKHWSQDMPASVQFVKIPPNFACSGRSTLAVLSSSPARKQIADLIGETMNAQDEGFSVFVMQSRDDEHTLRVVLRKLADETTPKVAPAAPTAPARPRAYAGGAAERQRAQAKAQGK
jgi:hypothetical protein